MKTCTRCSESKPLEAFPRSKAERTGYKPGCKACESLWHKADYLKNREEHVVKSSIYQKKNRKARTTYTKLWRLTNVYKITQEQYNQLLLKQENRCAICSKHRDDLDRELCVDHNHETNKVRGLLCYHCNVALGYMKDNITALLSAAKYLEAASASSFN